MRTPKRLFTSLILTLCLFLAPALALADGMYVTGLGGYTFVPDIDGDINGTNVGQASLDDGWKAGGSFGYDFGSIRVEAESFYGENDISSISSGLLPTLRGSGETSIFAVMGNLLYDIEIEQSKFTPYLGGGAGWAQVDFKGSGSITVPGRDFARSRREVGPQTLSASVDSSDSGFAYQLIGGVGYDFTDNLAGFVDYRYFRMDSLDLPLGINADYQTHSVNVGVRYNF